MRFIDEPYTRPRRGHTRGVLSISTSSTIAVRFSAWLISSLVVSLSPIFLLVALISWSPGQAFPEYGARAIGFAISLVSMYWALTLLVLGQIATPQWFMLHQVICTAKRHTWRHRSHVSFMRQDRMRRFLNKQPFTVFVRGAGQVSIAILVTASSTVDDLVQILVQRQIIPTNCCSVYTLGHGLVPFLQGSQTMASLGAGSLSHFYLRTRVCGGAKQPSASDGTSLSSGNSAVPVSAKSTRPKRVKSDEDVWNFPDTKIIELSKKSWKSAVYDHYVVTLERCHEKRALTFRFTCRFDPTGHPSLTRGRLETSQGTSNLERSRKKCMQRRGVDETHVADAQQLVTYSQPKHRALIAARCASSRRPFNSVADPYYIQEVEMLRPGTKLPSPATVSRDINMMYKFGGDRVRDYFSKHNGAVHLVMDGWTSQILASYLGIVAIWFSAGKVHRCILEFTRIKERHTGEHLARISADCIKRFGLEEKVHVVCMDNAGNCNTMVEHLSRLIPGFRGAESRTRCFPHTVNLIAKAFLSFFYRQRSKPKAAEPERPKRGGRGKHPTPEELLACGGNDPDLAAALEPTSEEAEMCEELEFEDQDDAEVVDVEKVAHDKQAVASVRTEAVLIAKTKFRIELDSDEANAALGLFPKITGLARKLNESQPLQLEFERLINPNNTQCRTLTRRVPTRWNSDFAALKSHMMFRREVLQLIAANSLSKKYALSEKQWVLTKHLAEILVIFDDITALFSCADVPLVHEVVPMLMLLEERLENVRDESDLPKVIRIAAIASLLVVEKYSKLSDLSEVYRIAMVMCPDKKLTWFDDEQATVAAELVRQRWSDSYEAFSDVEASSHYNGSPIKAPSKWLLSGRHRARRVHGYVHDSIEAYLAEPPVPVHEINNAGGVLQYWEKLAATRPHLACMALDFLTAPASSVDAERAFSGGRLQVNHLQRGMSSQTFKAQMAVGSWIRSDIFPTLEPFAAAIERESSRLQKGKEKAVVASDDDTDFEWNGEDGYD